MIKTMTSQSLPEGLILIANVISPDEETHIIGWLDKQPWSDTLSRRTQHYGYEYQYKTGASLKPTADITGPLLTISNRLSDAGYLNSEQCIINEYTRGQGIAHHIDKPSQFGPVIVSISLGADVVMEFRHREHHDIDVLLPARSMLVMSGPSRYEWKHGIPRKIKYMVDGIEVTKPMDYRRISLTYRSVI